MYNIQIIWADSFLFWWSFLIVFIHTSAFLFFFREIILPFRVDRVFCSKIKSDSARCVLASGLFTVLYWNKEIIFVLHRNLGLISEGMWGIFLESNLSPLHTHTRESIISFCCHTMNADSWKVPDCQLWSLQNGFCRDISSPSSPCALRSFWTTVAWL